MAKADDKKQKDQNQTSLAAPKAEKFENADSKTAEIAKTGLADLALIHSPTEDGKGARILRYRNGELSAGEVRPAEEGKPLGDGELVKLKPMENAPGLCNVEVLHDGSDSNPAQTASSKQRKQGHGPARVSNNAFRSNWNQVFSKPAAQKRKPDSTPGEPAASTKRKTGPDWSVN